MFKIKQLKEKVSKKIKQKIKEKKKKIKIIKRYPIDFSTEFSVEFGSLESRTFICNEENEYHFINFNQYKKNDIIYDDELWNNF